MRRNLRKWNFTLVIQLSGVFLQSFCQFLQKRATFWSHHQRYNLEKVENTKNKMRLMPTDNNVISDISDVGKLFELMYFISFPFSKFSEDKLGRKWFNSHFKNCFRTESSCTKQTKSTIRCHLKNLNSSTFTLDKEANTEILTHNDIWTWVYKARSHCIS